jgi:hypothetical protein
LTYDYVERMAWLDDTTVESEGDRWALCAGHAETFRVPRGWTCRDRRSGPRPAQGSARLFVPEPNDVAVVATSAAVGPDAGPADRAVAV